MTIKKNFSFTYESSSKLSIPEQYKNLQDKYNLFDKLLTIIISSYRFTLKSLEKGDIHQFEDDINDLNGDVSKLEHIIELWKRAIKKTRRNSS